MSYIPYDNWGNKLINALDNLDSLSLKKIGKICRKKFRNALTTLEDIDITYDFGVITPVILSCKRIFINNKDAYKITSHLSGVDDLVLYLEPNATPCSRYVALMYTIL